MTHIHGEPKSLPQGSPQLLKQLLSRKSRHRTGFHRHAQVLHALHRADFQAKLRNGGKVSNDGFNAAGEHIVAANDQHVIHSAKNPALQPAEHSSGGVRIAADRHKVSRAISQQRAAGAPEIGDDQFARLTVCNRVSSRIDNFGNALGLQQVHASGTICRFAGQRPQLCHTPMVDDPGFPLLFDLLPSGSDGSARFASHNQHADGSFFQVHPLGCSHFSHPQGIGGSTAQHGGFIFYHCLQADCRGHATACKAEVAITQSTFKSRPEAKEWSEGKRKKQAIPRLQSGQHPDLPPALHAPVPAVSSIHPADRATGGSGCLMQSLIPS